MCWQDRDSLGLRTIMAHEFYAENEGEVSHSNRASHVTACSRLSPHIVCSGASDWQTAGRSGEWKRRHEPLASSCTQRTPAGLPCGMPGMALLMEGAMQQAPQPGRQASGRVMALAQSPCPRRQAGCFLPSPGPVRRTVRRAHNPRQARARRYRPCSVRRGAGAVAAPGCRWRRY